MEFNLAKSFFSKLKILLKSKWVFSAPKTKRILIFDANNNPLTKYFKVSEMGILHTRGEVLNIYVLLVCLFSGKLNPQSYYKEYIKNVKPKIILTFIDNASRFYLIKELTNIKTAFVQNGTRTYWNDVFSLSKINNKNNKKKFFVDYMFVFNKHIAKIYSSFISGKTILIGSFRNNINNINLKFKKKKEILFISGHRVPKIKSKKIINPNKIKNKNKIYLNHYNFFKNDDKFIKWLGFYSQKKNIKLNILGKTVKYSKLEEEYFKKILKNNKFTYIPNSEKRKTYETLGKYKYIFAIESTLAIENLVKYGRTGFFFNRPNIFPISSRRFGGMEKLKPKGPFWTTGNSTNEFIRVFNFVTESSAKVWNKTVNNYKNEVMVYDPGNKKFLNIIKNVIKN